MPKPQTELKQPRSFLDAPSLSSTHKPPKPTAEFRQTEEQVKLDAEEEEFVKKGVEEGRKVEHKLEEVEEDEVVVDKIKWLNEEEQPVRQIDLTQEVEKNWQQGAEKGSFQKELWSNSLLKGKGQLSEFVRDAIERFDEDEEQINRRKQEKRNMRNRYG